MSERPDEEPDDETPFESDESEGDFEEGPVEESLAEVDVAPGAKADKRAVRVRRAIERHRERRALRDLIADGFTEPWDEFDLSSSLPMGVRPRS